MTNILILYSFLFAVPMSMAQASDCASHVQSANDLYKCALDQDPRIRSLLAREKARTGRDKEARQIPNPVGEFEGSSGEVGVSIVQPIEIGGKRSARIKLSGVENEISLLEEKLEFGEIALTIIQNITRLSQTNTKLKLLEDTRKSLINLSTKLKAKAVRSPQDRTALNIFQMQSTLIEARLINLRREQAQATRLIEASFDGKFGDLSKVTAPEVKKWPSLEGLQPSSGLNVRLRELAIKRFEAKAKVQKSAAWPDVAIGPLYFKDESSANGAIGLKLGFGLPLWNRNQGAVLQSEAELEETRLSSGYALAQARFSIEVFIDSYKNLVTFLSQTSSSPSLQKSVKETLQLFSRGMVEPSNVIETYRTAYETMEAVQEAEYSAITYYWMIQTALGEIPKEIP
ncbi:MAG: TolC family protein [Bdellovibrionales bacterium]|nr:TolC family protein [Bdellovibrionales bacterium]